MLKVNKQFAVRMGPVQGPTNVSPLEQRLYRMNYRCAVEKYTVRLISGWRNDVAGKGKAFRVRRWYRGLKCVRVIDIVSYIPNGVEVAQVMKI